MAFTPGGDAKQMAETVVGHGVLSVLMLKGMAMLAFHRGARPSRQAIFDPIAIRRTWPCGRRAK
jgi:hypothetical protein